MEGLEEMTNFLSLPNQNSVESDNEEGTPNE
jgi:hypothetical protein